MTRAKASRISGCEIVQVSAIPLIYQVSGEAGVFRMDFSGVRKPEAQILSMIVEKILAIHRKIVRERAGFRCEECGAMCPLEVDHIVGRGMGGARRDDRLGNLRALGTSAAGGGCGCHERRHKEGL